MEDRCRPHVSNLFGIHLRPLKSMSVPTPSWDLMSDFIETHIQGREVLFDIIENKPIILFVRPRDGNANRHCGIPR